jgi:hypothetical protein
VSFRIELFYAASEGRLYDWLRAGLWIRVRLSPGSGLGPRCPICVVVLSRICCFLNPDPDLVGPGSAILLAGLTLLLSVFNATFFLFWIADYSRETLAAAEAWRMAFLAAASEADPQLPPKKIFVPTFDLPDVADYKTDPGPDFWTKFPSNIVTTGKSWVDPDRLAALALDTGYTDMKLLHAVCHDLRHGATLGCASEFRQPTASSNAASAYEFSPHITDAIARWLS